MTIHSSFSFSGRLPILLLVGSLSCFGANRYIRAGAAGTGMGTDWHNACADFTGACDVKALVRGDTYYIADGTYAGRRFNTPALGASLITIKKATQADHGTDVGWLDEYGDGQAIFNGPIYFSSDYWVWDGQTRASLTAGHGFRIDIKTTVTPTTYAGLYIGDPFSGPGGTPANHITVRYFEVTGSGDRSEPKVYRDNGVQAATTHRQQNITIGHFYIRDSGGVSIKLENLSNVVVEHGYMTRNHSTPESHSEAIAARTIDTFTTRHCWFVDIEGTAHLTTAGGSSGVGSNWYIYGNVFMRTPGNPFNIANVGNGPIYFLDTNISGDIQIYNNTVFNMTTDGDRGGIGRFSLNRVGNSLGNVKVMNNLWSRSREPYSTCESCNTFEWSHNAYFDVVWNIIDPDTQKHVAIGNPFLDSSGADFQPAVSMPGGVPLPFPFDVDAAGRQRGLTGSWARGAMEYPSGSPDLLVPPGNLTATVK